MYHRIVAAVMPTGIAVATTVYCLRYSSFRCWPSKWVISCLVVCQFLFPSICSTSFNAALTFSGLVCNTNFCLGEHGAECWHVYHPGIHSIFRIKCSLSLQGHGLVNHFAIVGLLHQPSPLSGHLFPYTAILTFQFKQVRLVHRINPSFGFFSQTFKTFSV